MTSTVSARLRPDASLADIFAALYPCGSITGAPKRRAMEIIAELEGAARGIYTGAIGWFEAPRGNALVGDFCLSVPIRTLALRPPNEGVRRGQLGIGAGIVFDSDARDEYAESLLKARFLTGLGHDFELFETMYATRGGVRHLERHLARLAASAAYFNFVCDGPALRARLLAHCAAWGDDAPRRLRLALDRHGAIALTDVPLAPLNAPVSLLLADDAVDSSALFSRHKTTRRARYDAAWREAEDRGAFDTVFFNERGELAEGGRSSVFIQLEGRWYTPPLSAGVLPGVMRAVLLDDPYWQASERILSRGELLAAENIVVCNALRGAVPAVLLT
jgi:para-aminobenzoate synthetase/4-amino-4-deoxychorismate lyase